MASRARSAELSKLDSPRKTHFDKKGIVQECYSPMNLDEGLPVRVTPADTLCATARGCNLP